MNLVQIYCLTVGSPVANCDLQVQTCCHSCHGMDAEAMDSSSDGEYSESRCSSAVLCCPAWCNFEAWRFWKVIFSSTLMFWKVFLVYTINNLRKACSPEMAICIPASSIDSTECQKEKRQGHILVQMFCTGKNLLTALCRRHLCAEFTSLSSFLHIKFSFCKNTYFEILL